MLSTEYAAGIPIKDIIDVFLKGGNDKPIYPPPKAEMTRWEVNKDHVVVYFQLEWKPYYRGEFEPPMNWYIYDSEH